MKLDGLAWSLARFVYPYPQFVSFDATYDDLIWLTWNGRVLDRRLLSELPRPVWDSVASALQENVSDAVIDDAIHQLPPGLATASGDFLRRTLDQPSQHLREAAIASTRSSPTKRRSTRRMRASSWKSHASGRGPRTSGCDSVRSLVFPSHGDWYHRRFDARRDTRDPASFSTEVPTRSSCVGQPTDARSCG